jgi:hypothetical protein
MTRAEEIRAYNLFTYCEMGAEKLAASYKVTIDELIEAVVKIENELLGPQQTTDEEEING